jgi:hypothetical protein
MRCFWEKWNEICFKTFSVDLLYQISAKFDQWFQRWNKHKDWHVLPNVSILCTECIKLMYIVTVGIMFLVTSWSRVLLGKPKVAQLLKKFHAFYRTQRFTTMFTRDCHWSLSKARQIQSTPSHHISLRSILIYTPTSSKWSLPIRFNDQNFVCIFHLSYAFYMPCSLHPPWFNHPNIWCITLFRHFFCKM